MKVWFLCVVGKAFAVATVIVFGGASVVFGLAASKLEVHNVSTYNCLFNFFFLHLILYNANLFVI